MSPRSGYGVFGNEKQEHMDVYIDGKKTTRVIDYYDYYFDVYDGTVLTKQIPYPTLHNDEHVIINSEGEIHIIKNKDMKPDSLIY